MFRPVHNRVAPIVGLVALSISLIAQLAQIGCGPKSVRLTVPQLRDLEACVLQEDQIERQNCVERLFPKGER